MLNLYSPEEIWQDFKIEETADPYFTNKREDENNVYYDVYFNGRRTESGITRIYGLFAYPKKVKCPVVLLCHDVNSSVDKEFVDFFLNLKYAVLMCDMYGEAEDRKYTYYPVELEFANRKENEEYRIVKDDPKSTMQYQWTCVQRYAINFIKSQGERVIADKICAVGIREGSEIVWRLACTEELTCAMPLFYAGWKEYEKMSKNGVGQIDDNTNAIASYIAGLSPQSQAPFIKVPTLFMTPSNYAHGGLDRAFDTMARANGEYYCPIYVSPGQVNAIDEDGTKNIKVWLDKNLKNTETILAERPLLSLENFSNKLVPKCIVDKPEEVLRVRFYYAEGVEEPSSRCYYERELSLSGDGYISSVNITSSEHKIYAFANVSYKNGFTITSNLVNFVLSEKGFEKDYNKENLIYNSLSGRDTFRALPKIEDNSLKGTFIEKDDLSVRVCYGGIKGLSSDMSMATFKFANPKYQGEKGNILVFDLFSEEQCSIELCAYTQNNDKWQRFNCTVKTVGGRLWQNFRLDEGDFKTEEQIPLSAWDEVKYMTFSSNDKYMINNILWL